jgi:hypothetical protein
MLTEPERKADLTVKAFVPSKDDNALLKLTVARAIRAVAGWTSDRLAPAILIRPCQLFSTHGAAIASQGLQVLWS